MTPGFVGRREELALLRRLVDRQRLVSLVGPPGIGKSALAACFTGTLTRSAWSGGALLVAARGVRGRTELAGLVARALDLDARRPTLEADVGRRLAARGPALLVLDDLDHGVKSAASLVGDWLAAAPELRVLVTAREPLRRQGEQRMEIGPLGGRSLGEAVQLFVARAREVRVEYMPRAAARAVIGEIVRRLEGNPLAIELAATRLSTLSEREVAEWLPGAIDTVGLRRAIRGSWDLLDVQQRADLAACSVFRGGFTLEAAAYVLSAKGSIPGVLERLQSLRERSLLKVDTRAGQATRFAIYESVGELARSKLRASGKEAAVQGRHAAYYASLAAAGAVEARDEANLQAVVVRGLRAGAVRAHHLAALETLVGLEARVSQTGPLAPYLALADGAERSGQRVPAVLLARVLLARGKVRVIAGRIAAGTEDLERAGAVARRAGEELLHGRAIFERGVAQMRRGLLEEAQPLFEAARATFHVMRAPALEAAVLGRLGLLHFRQGKLGEAVRCYEAEEPLLPADPAVRTAFHARLGAVHHERGAFAAARAEYRRAFVLARRARARRGQAIALAALGLLDWEMGRHDRARAAHERALAVSRAHGDVDYEGICLASLGGIEATAGHLARATRRLEEARQLLAPTANAHILAALTLYESMVVLARAARVARRDTTRARALTAQARAAIARVAGDAAVDGEDIRVALRVLRASFGEDPARPGERGGLLVSASGAWFQPAGRAVVSLGQKKALARLLVALATRHARQPGVPLATFELLDAGWPGEEVAALSGANRVYVALAALRKLGLASVLVRSGDGYLFDPRVALSLDPRP
jgi:predicted ATPase